MPRPFAWQLRPVSDKVNHITLEFIMNRIRRVLVAIVCATPLFAAAPPTMNRLNARDVAKLIIDLGDRDFIRRDAAQRQLASLGAPILPYLYRAMNSPDLEVRRRVMRLIVPLENERDFRPNRINGTFRDAPIEKVLAELRTQTGYRVQLLEPGKQLFFTGTFRDVPFWEALDAVCTACRLVPMDNSDDKGRPGIALRPTKQAARFVSREGVFRLNVPRIEQQRALDLESDEDNENEQPPMITLTLNVSAEPRFRFVEVGQPRLQSATDDRGRSLLPVRTEMPPEVGVMDVGPSLGNAINGPTSTGVSIPLARHYAESSRLKMLKGVLPARVVIGHTTRLVVDGIAKNRSWKQGWFQFVIDEVKAQKKRNEFRIVVRLKNEGPGAIDFDPGISQHLIFQDADGNPCRHSPVDQPQPDTLIIRVSPSRKGSKPATKILFKDALIKWVEIPFEFHNLPLP